MMRVLYFIYFLIKSDYKKVRSALKCLSKKYSSIKLFFDSIYCSLKFGTSLDDYFSFRFYQKDDNERSEFASTAYMYQFHKSLNSKKYVKKVDDKSQFRKYFYQYSNISEVFRKNEKGKFIKWLKFNNIKEFVIKDPLGTVGNSINFITYNKLDETFQKENNDISLDRIFKKYSNKGILYVEKKIDQHSMIQSLSPTAINTIRLITVLRKDGEVDIISAAFRISVNSKTDNFSKGNLAAAIDINTGIVISPGIKRLAACSELYNYHPLTNEKILGLNIPYWEETLKIVKTAAKIIPQVRTVGWDIAILEDKPIIIEGNPGWNKGAPQIPLDKGIKPILDKYLGKNGL